MLPLVIAGATRTSLAIILRVDVSRELMISSFSALPQQHSIFGAIMDPLQAIQISDQVCDEVSGL